MYHHVDVLSCKLPHEIARLVIEHMACTKIQSCSRGFTVRRQLPPQEFRLRSTRISHDALTALTQSFSPGAYKLDVQQHYVDGTTSHSYTRCAVSPNYGWCHYPILLQECVRAVFEEHHGTCSYRVCAHRITCSSSRSVVTVKYTPEFSHA